MTWNNFVKKVIYFQSGFVPEDSFPEGQLVKMGKKAIQLLGVQDQVR